MSYQVLARKWRPKTFTDVVGHKYILTAISHMLSFRRIHHAYLLSGTRGVGKTTIARLLAKGLNCETGITTTPCSHCDNCYAIENGRFVDMIEIDAASRTKVEDTRELLDNIQYAPSHGRFKVYLIDEVHMLSRYSFNALLKTLEEPPKHIIFLLATTEPQKLPLTILSRCLQFHLKALNYEEIFCHLSMVLQKEKISAAPRALKLLARSANGSMRDALNLADQAIAMGQGKISDDDVSIQLGMLNTEQSLSIIEALANADGKKMMSQLAQFADNGTDWETLLIEIMSLLHRIALGQIFPEQLNDADDLGLVPRLKTLARRLLPDELQLYYQTLLIGRKELPFSPDSRIGVEMTFLRALAFHPKEIDTSVILSSQAKKKVKSDADEDKNDQLIDNQSLYLMKKLNQSHIIGDTQIEYESVISMEMRTPELSRNHNNYLQDSKASTTPTHHTAKIKSLIEESKDSSLIEESKDSGCTKNHIKDYVQNKTVSAEDTKPTTINTVSDSVLPVEIAKLLHARSILRRYQERQKIKNNRLVSVTQTEVIKGISLIASTSIDKRVNNCYNAIISKDTMKSQKSRSVRSLCFMHHSISHPTTLMNYKELCQTMEHKTKQVFVLSVEKELLNRDPWAAQIHRLEVPKIVRQLALNSWKEDLENNKVCLHLNASQHHLNSVMARNTLQNALSADIGVTVELIVIEDHHLDMKTPLEWRKIIYDDKLIKVRQCLINDSHIKMLQRFFDAELEEDSIRPI